MAHIVTDRVLETTTTTGTGNITLAGAVSQFQDFDSQMANTDTTAYFIKGISGSALTEWEVGLGTWNTGNTLSRTTVIRSSNSNAAVNLSAGTKLIGMTFTPSVRQPGMTFTGALTPATNDLAALGSASLSWADLFLASGGVVNFASDVTLTHSTDLLLINGGGVSLGWPGSTTVAPLTFSPVSPVLVTTPQAGQIEMDATNLYGTTDTGNRGYIPVRHYIRAASAQTLTSTGSAQSIFDSPANGRITLETGAYYFRMIVGFTNMSATSGNASILFGGSGTFGDWFWTWSSADLTSLANVVADVTSYATTNTTPVPAITGTTATTMRFQAEGSFECSGAGTWQPVVALTTAAAATVVAGSICFVERIGAAATASVGQWD